MMHFPDSVSPGDGIGIVAPARRISPSELEYAIEWIRDRGFEPIKAPNLHGSFHQFSGSDDERAEDINWCLRNPDVKAILCARGGYGCVRLLDLIDWDLFRKNPKWISGYSDITVLLNAATHHNVASVHCSMPVNFPKNTRQSTDGIAEIWAGKRPSYTWKNQPENRSGKATGRLVGGNLSVLFSQRGTPNDLYTEGVILFLEDLDEYLYHIDRMMENLAKGSWFERIAGLVVGGMTAMNDNAIPFGYAAEESILRAIEPYDFPVAFGFPAGHLDHNLPLIIGAEVELSVDENCQLTFV
jgi:muramoyltetrapeptide carboxypeptidase